MMAFNLYIFHGDLLAFRSQRNIIIFLRSQMIAHSLISNPLQSYFISVFAFSRVFPTSPVFTAVLNIHLLVRLPLCRIH